MLKLARRARGHFVTLIEIRVHLIRVKPGHISAHLSQVSYRALICMTSDTTNCGVRSVGYSEFLRQHFSFTVIYKRLSSNHGLKSHIFHEGVILWISIINSLYHSCNFGTQSFRSGLTGHFGRSRLNHCLFL